MLLPSPPGLKPRTGLPQSLTLFRRVWCNCHKRSIAIWHHEGVPARVLAERAGHARASMSLDVYSRVHPPGEVASASLQR
jgi:hypothetical protein